MSFRRKCLEVQGCCSMSCLVASALQRTPGSIIAPHLLLMADRIMHAEMVIASARPKRWSTPNAAFEAWVHKYVQTRIRKYCRPESSLNLSKQDASKLQVKACQVIIEGERKVSPADIWPWLCLVSEKCKSCGSVPLQNQLRPLNSILCIPWGFSEV